MRIDKLNKLHNREDQTWGYYNRRYNVDFEFMPDVTFDRFLRSKVYKVYTDSQHGWIAVKRQELVDLGIHKNITSWSYQKGNTAYLEEDWDLSQFYEAYHKKHGFYPRTKIKYSERSPIRSYEAYQNFDV